MGKTPAPDRGWHRWPHRSLTVLDPAGDRGRNRPPDKRDGLWRAGDGKWLRRIRAASCADYAPRRQSAEAIRRRWVRRLKHAPSRRSQNAKVRHDRIATMK